jgi:hypothetical protein
MYTTSEIRCAAKGVTTGDDVLVFRLTHPGIETFYREDGHSIGLHHIPVLLQYKFNMKSSKPPFKMLDEDHSMIGPFCEWIIAIPALANRDLNLRTLESNAVEFKGKHRAFNVAPTLDAASEGATG